MTLFILSYLAGALTIVAPCILPVLPFVFARTGEPFRRSGLPLLVGMALSFAGVATLATFGGAWAAEANQWGRFAAMALLAAVGVALLVPRWAERVARPLVVLGERLGSAAETARRAGRGGAVDGAGRPRRAATVGPSILLGAATGLLWAPCAGPVLALVLAGAALQGPSAHTSLLLLAYAAGAATALGAALWAGGRVASRLKRSLRAAAWLRRGLGAAVLAAVALVALGLDVSLLARVPAPGSEALEQALLDRFHAPTDPPRPGLRSVRTAASADALPALPVEGRLPDLSGATGWLQSPPLTAEGLRGHVVLVNIWTFGCVNCQRAMPHVRGWAEKYRDQGLVTVGVHTPEFAYERKTENVRRAAAEMQVAFPIALDNDFAIWRGFSNRYWPALYFVDAEGRIRHHRFGEGDYARSEEVIRQLLAEARISAGRS